MGKKHHKGKSYILVKEGNLDSVMTEFSLFLFLVSNSLFSLLLWITVQQDCPNLLALTIGITVLIPVFYKWIYFSKNYMVSSNIDVLIGNSEMYIQMWVDMQLLMFIRLTFPTRYLQRNHWILIPRIALSVLKLSNCKELLHLFKIYSSQKHVHRRVMSGSCILAETKIPNNNSDNQDLWNASFAWGLFYMFKCIQLL